MSNNISLIQQSISRTATQRLSNFIRSGNKENRELLLRDLFIRRAKKSRKNLEVANKEKQVTTSQLFHSIRQSVTPFISLKTRRRRRGRGNRVFVKLAPLERKRGERKALIWLSSKLHSEGASSMAFSERLERELETLSIHSNENNIEAVVEQKAVHSLREKRDEIHRLAFRARPYRWKRITKQKEKQKIKK